MSTWWETLVPSMGRAQWRAGRPLGAAANHVREETLRETFLLLRVASVRAQGVLGMGRHAGKNWGEFLNRLHNFFRVGGWTR